MLYLFDFDGTLVVSYLDRPDHNYHLVEVLLNRPEQLAALLAAGHTVGLVTNQPGVARGVVTEADWARKLAHALTALGLPAETPVAGCFAAARAPDVRYRDPGAVARGKPSGAMIRELMAAYPVAAAEGVLLVGGADDAAAAQAAGVAFQWWFEFFGEPA